MSTLSSDLRFGLRLLLKRPGFTLVTTLTLALGIGANTAIFSVVHAALLSAVPFEDPEELVYLGEWSEQIPTMSVSYPNFLDWRERQRSFGSMAAHRFQSYNLTGTDRPEQVAAVHASATLLPTLRVKPQLGRNFTAAEDRVGSEKVVIVSYGFWQRRLGGDEQAIGLSVELDGESYEVVGVMPEGFVYPLFRRVEMWLPIEHFAARWRERRSSHPGIYVTARLRPGMDAERAEVDMDRIAAELAAEYPDSNANHGVTYSSLQQRVVRNTRPALLVLSGAVALVLLIACVNVANLLLARGTGRRQEMALRGALGAGRWQVARQLLAESVMLALLGGLVGLAVAYGTLRWVVSLDPRTFRLMGEIGLSGPVLFFTAFVSVVTGVLFGLAPAAQSWRRNLSDSLKEGAKGSSGVEHHRMRSALVVAEVGLALVILVAAVLFVRSFAVLTAADPGFDPRNVLTFSVALPTSIYEEDAQQAAFFDALVERLRALPGVRSAATTMPLLGGWQDTVIAEGMEARAPGEEISADITRVSTNYFEALGLRVLRGRVFNDADRVGAMEAAVVDQTFAETFWPDEDPIGKRLKFDSDPASEEPWITVVGLVNHVKNYGVDQASRIEIYRPTRQDRRSFATVVVKTELEPHGILPAVEAEMLALDRDQPIARVRTLEEIVAGTVLPQRLAATLLGAFAVVALLLAAIGIYGVMAYSVEQRQNEIGIRMALGARSRDVLRMVVGQGIRLAGLGVLLGFAVAFLAAPVVSSQLYGVDARDPWTLLTLPGVLIAVAVAACALPARRASRVAPTEALRYE